MRALLLNADYTPLAPIAARRALGLVMAGKAEVVDPSEKVFHSATQTFSLPTVLRLVKYVKVPYRRSIQLTRKTVLARDGHRCAYCPGVADTIDHIKPKALGGQHIWENVVAACGPCNRKKGNKKLSDLGWTMRNTPYRPQGVGAWLLKLEPDPAWAQWLMAA